MRLASFALIVLVAWGCASGKAAYVDGMELETQGDLGGAATAYVTALERDRSLPNVAGRLAVAGRGAVRQWVAEAAAEDAEAAAGLYRQAQALIDRSAAVGVTLDRPAAFEADRDEAYAAAVDALLAEAEQALDAADFARALDRVGRARAYDASATRRADLDALQLDTYDAWAEADLAAGRFRSALAHTEAALTLGPAPARLAALDGLRGAIVDAGRVVLAVFPAEGDDAPEAFRRDLTDVLADERLRDADPFLVLVDPAAVRRWERDRRGTVELGDSPRRLGEAAAALRADLGAVVIVGDLDEQEIARDSRTETVSVRRTGAEATIAVREIALEVWAEADAVVVEAGTGRAACDVSVRERGRATYDRASTAADWQALDLSRRQRAAFAPDADDRARADARDDLRDRLATALAERVRRCLDARVP